MLDLCQNKHADDWVLVPGNRPATTMLAGVFDPGMKDEAKTRPLAGHSIAVYEPDPQLSMVWPIPEEPEAERPDRLERFIPEWAEKDGHGWKNANMSYVVILLGGAPVWQAPVWYLDWGSGIGATSHMSKRCSATTSLTENGRSRLGRIPVGVGAVGMARLINAFGAPREWYAHDPTSRLVPKPGQLHPVDARRAGL